MYFVFCFGGNKEIVELMIEKGANDWNKALRNACKGGKKEIVELMIEKGANDWNWGLRGACEGGNKEIAKIMKHKGGNNDRCHHDCHRLCDDGSILH